MKGAQTYDAFWSPDNRQIVYNSNKENPPIVNLYIRDISGASRETRIFQNFTEDGQIYGWSINKSPMLVVKTISENDKLLYSADDESYAIEQVNPYKSGIAYSDAQFLPRQNVCLSISDEFSEFLQLHYYDLTTKKSMTTNVDIAWDVEALTIDSTG